MLRGGEHENNVSKTITMLASYVLAEDSNSPYPQMSFITDTMKVNANMAIGLGPNSTFLAAHKKSGKIGARSFGMFWGFQGANSNTQLDGSIVFGGYDRGKVKNTLYTQPPSPNRASCSTGLLVTITNIILNSPTAQTLVFSRRARVSTSYFPVSTLDERFHGDLTTNLDTGLSVHITNDKLIIPEASFDKKSGHWLDPDPRNPTLIINPLAGNDAKHNITLGRPFLSGAYLVNEETNQFSLSALAPTAGEDMVAFDSERTNHLAFVVLLPRHLNQQIRRVAWQEEQPQEEQDPTLRFQVQVKASQLG
ncbi:hypothetical protein B0H63DRAFT_524718 [Podospora didyma]|uniref:Peptidase A1 domain-containing protein n=1 Tax=Podospora didyma TaxID=330526 RepID=A0AAE0NBK4_9PEZI|nr:hypothetical protein B0H63DRAFT_524718 [Podospora didyma]